MTALEPLKNYRKSEFKNQHQFAPNTNDGWTTPPFGTFASRSFDRSIFFSASISFV